MSANNLPLLTHTRFVGILVRITNEYVVDVCFTFAIFERSEQIENGTLRRSNTRT